MAAARPKLFDCRVETPNVDLAAGAPRAGELHPKNRKIKTGPEAVSTRPPPVAARRSPLAAYLLCESPEVSAAVVSDLRLLVHVKK